MGDDAGIEQPDTDAVDFSVQLETWLASDHDKTLGDLGDVFTSRVTGPMSSPDSAQRHHRAG